jgi:hypothetical protein
MGTMNNAITTQVQTTVARQIRSVYARRWSSIDPRDIEHQALLYALEASANAPTVVENPKAFLWRAVTPELVVWLWKQTKPITVTKYAVRESKKSLDYYAAMVCDSFTDQVAVDMAEHIERGQWIVAVQARIRELLNDADSRALAVLLDERKPRDIDGSAREIYNVTRQARRRIERDAELQRLWLDR